MYPTLAAFFAILALYFGIKYFRLTRSINNISTKIKDGLALVPTNTEHNCDRSLEPLIGTFNQMQASAAIAEESRTDFVIQTVATLEQLSEAVIVVDHAQRIILSNTVARALLQINDDTETTIERCIKSSSFLEIFRELKEKGSINKEIISLRSNEEDIHLEFTGTKLPGTATSNGPLIIIALNNISKLHRLENIRKEFVSNVSHEIRTPVTVIKGFSETLIENYSTISKEDCEKFLKKIHRNIERIHLLLEDLLTLSKIEGRTAQINLQKISLTNLIDDALDALRDSHPGLKSDLVDVETDPDTDELMGDPIKLSQVMVNLLENAVTYGRGLSKIVIRSRCENEHIHIEIEDDGCGIPAKDVPHIFERFYRVDKGRSNETGGTGLGLSIVKHIILIHGGEISAVSTEGKGTCMHFYLPISPPSKP